FTRRLDEIRRRILARPGRRSGTEDLEILLEERRRERERLEDEADYRGRERRAEAVTVAGTTLVDPGAIDVRARGAGRPLEAPAAVETLPLAPLDAAEIKAKLKSARFLLAPCRKCHETGAASLAPLLIDLPLLPLAVFDHKAHAGLLACATCHAQR